MADLIEKVVELNSRFKRIAADGGDVSSVRAELSSACSRMSEFMDSATSEQRRYVRALLRAEDLRDSWRVLLGLRAARDLLPEGDPHRDLLPDEDPFLKPWADVLSSKS
jgi:hypothetical protein